MNSVAAGTLVHLIFIDPASGIRHWFVRTDRRQNPVSKVYQTWPLVDSDPRNSVPITYEFAIVAHRRWRDELGLNFRLALEPNGELIDENIVSRPAGPWPHEDVLVTVDAGGNLFDSPNATHVYLVRAVRTTEGPMFCLRFETAVLQHQAQFSTIAEGPQVAVERAIARGYHKLEKPRPNPHLQARQREAELRAAQSLRPAQHIRPGDRN